MNKHQSTSKDTKRDCNATYTCI